MPAADKGKEPKIKKKPGRTPTSCAECRRLKLRCDRNVPCEKCISRGCAGICPDGVLISTKGNRMVLSGTEELHERILQLQGRIRELESGLRSVQTKVSDEPHPLLSDDTLRLPYVPTPSQVGSSPATGSSSKSSAVSQPSPTGHPPATHVTLKQEEKDPIDAFGTLTIGPNGATIYIGKTARSEFLIRAPLKQESDFPTSSHLGAHFSENSISPFPDLDTKETLYLREQVYKMLPPLSEAVRLCEVYLDHGKCMYTAVTRTELLDEILMTIYRSQSYEAFQSHHALALLFSVFALASHFDPHKEPYSKESREYYQLARTTLGFASPVKQTTLAAIQTLIHMAQYLDFTDSESTSAWLYIGHAVRFAFSIGLHLDGGRWTLPPHEINRRSRVFWQLFSLDTWTSFYFGRPPSISPNFIDCEYPKEKDDAGQEMGFHSWCYRFTTLMNSAMSSGMGPKQPAYVTILQLDCQIRNFHVPEPWKSTSSPESPPPSPDIHLYRWLVLAGKETLLLNLHRAYFAQALRDNAHDIQKHRYLPSVVAIYRASWRLIRGLQIAWAAAPRILERIQLPWSQAVSAAIVMCLLVTKSPSSHLTAPALEALEALYSLFHTASASSKPAATLITSIESLCQKAQEATNPAQHQAAGYSQPPITQIELDRLSGGTHLFSDTQGSVSPPHASSYPTDKPGSASSVTAFDIPDPSTLIPSFPSYTSDYALHPIILEDLKDFAQRSPVPTIRSLSDSTSNPEVAPTDVQSAPSSMIVSTTPPSSFTAPSSSRPLGDEHTPTPRQAQQEHEQRTPSRSHSSYPSHSTLAHPRSTTEIPHGSTHPQVAPRYTPPDELSSHSYPHPHRSPPPSPPPRFLPPRPDLAIHTPSLGSGSSQHPPRSSRLPPTPRAQPAAAQPRHASSHNIHSLLIYAPEFPQHYESMDGAQRLPPAMGSTSDGLPSGSSGGSGSGGSRESDTFASSTGAGPGTGFVMGFEPGAPIILDETWQGFIEQLGF